MIMTHYYIKAHKSLVIVQNFCMDISRCNPQTNTKFVVSPTPTCYSPKLIDPVFLSSYISMFLFSLNFHVRCIKTQDEVWVWWLDSDAWSQLMGVWHWHLLAEKRGKQHKLCLAWLEGFGTVIRISQLESVCIFIYISFSLAQEQTSAF